jgi:hypothetical protein
LILLTKVVTMIEKLEYKTSVKLAVRINNVTMHSSKNLKFRQIITITVICNYWHKIFYNALNCHLKIFYSINIDNIMLTAVSTPDAQHNAH